MYTDISAGFFADAEARFGTDGASIDFRVLDIEKDPIDQGFDPHAYDLVIAANVLHATRHLDETLAHCRALLAPSGLLVALENQRGRGWMDLIFGQLDGWWRFADRYRANHALAGPDVWREALADSGFAASEVLGVDRSEASGLPDRGVIVAQGPAKIDLPEGVWILAADRGGMAASLAAQLAAQNQRVVLAGDDPEGAGAAAGGEDGIVATPVEMERRESWRSLIEDLPPDVPFARRCASRFPGRSRGGRDDRGHGGRCKADGGERSRPHAGDHGCGRRARERRVVSSPAARRCWNASGPGSWRVPPCGASAGWWHGKRPSCNPGCSISPPTL